MSWEKAKQIKEGSSFLKLGDGESVRLVFVGEPHVFYQAKDAFKTGDKTEWSQWAEGRTTRFKINAAVQSKDGWEMKIFSSGRTVLSNLVELKEKYGLRRMYELKRKGTGTETEYYLMPEMEELSDTAQAAIDVLKPHSFATGRMRAEEDESQEYDERNPPPPTDADAPAEEEDIPF